MKKQNRFWFDFPSENSLFVSRRSENLESVENRPTPALECDQSVGAISEECEVDEESPRHSHPKSKLSKGSLKKNKVSDVMHHISI